MLSNACMSSAKASRITVVVQTDSLRRLQQSLIVKQSCDASVNNAKSKNAVANNPNCVNIQ